jgi:hypothetical protein
MKHLILTLMLLASTVGLAEAQYRTCTTNCYGPPGYRTCTTTCH